MDLVIAVSGLYILYGFVRLIFMNKVTKGLFASGGKNPDKCTDIRKFKAEVAAPMLLLGICALASGGLGLYQDCVKVVSITLYDIFFVFFLAMLLWFGYSSKRAAEKYLV